MVAMFVQEASCKHKVANYNNRETGSTRPSLEGDGIAGTGRLVFTRANCNNPTRDRPTTGDGVAGTECLAFLVSPIGSAARAETAAHQPQGVQKESQVHTQQYARAKPFN